MTKKQIQKHLLTYPDALTVKEVSQILRLSTKTVYKLLKDGTIPSVKIGRERRISKCLLVDFLRQNDKDGLHRYICPF